MSEKVKNLILIIEDIQHIPSRYRDISDYSSNPLNSLIYKEILKCSPIEVDDYKNKRGRSNVIYDKMLTLKNPYLFSGFLSIGAFKSQLSAESLWLLDKVKSPPLELSNAILQHERNEGFFVNDAKPKDKINFIPHIATYLDLLDTPEKEKVAQLVYEKYKDNPQELLKNCFDNIKRPVSKFLIKKFKSIIDINIYGFLDEYLSQNSQSTFFISSTHFTSLKSLLSAGFRFNEEKYNKLGDTLMTSVLKSDSPEVVSIILPYLTGIDPKGISLDEQTKLLDNYSKSPFYEKIKVNYYKTLYYYKLKEKEESPALKVKI